MPALIINTSPQARRSYIALYAIRRSFSTSSPQASSGHFNRSDFGNQPFTGIYEPGAPTGGPLGGASTVGAPRITPKSLKQHLDQFVIGQERAKKVLSSAIYNHYKRIQEIQRQEDEQEEILAQQARRDMRHRHPVEGTANIPDIQLDEYPGQQPTILQYPLPPPQFQDPDPPPINDESPLTIEKSNILLLGPSGVGKTLMAKTLARVLEVPFSMSDCTPLTQAGYIGEDAEVCVQRLLAAANYDVARAEQGIICLDEIDKIATAKVTHGKDVSGEGVQQALLKIIEGTTVQVQSKNERGAPSTGRSASQSNVPPNMTGSGAPNQPSGNRNEVYNVRTDNILFICTGAFIGLHKFILDRISRGSIGFGATVRASPSDSTNPHDTTIRGEDELFRKHLPFYHAPESPGQYQPHQPAQKATYNTLDLVEPADLQKFGMIPELIGRIPISCAVSSLDEEALVRVLTEPRNALLRQYEAQFQLSGIELRFTTGALREVAKSAVGMGTGARGLKTAMERLLGEAMFETPGSPVKHILITERVAQRKQPPIYMSRGQSAHFNSIYDAEEEEWARRQSQPEHGAAGGDGVTFEQYREKAKAAGVV